MQTVDIDLNNILWGQIIYFCGNYNGNNCIIENFQISVSASNNECGFFGLITNAQLRNINLQNISFNVSQLNPRCGALVGSASESSIENCTVTGLTMKLGGKNTNYCGGIVGNISKSTINKCVVDNSTFTSTSTVSEQSSLGGIVGYTNGLGSVTNCCVTNTNFNFGRYFFQYCGGIIGDIHVIPSDKTFFEVKYNYVDDKTNMTCTDDYSSYVISGIVGRGSYVVCQYNTFLGSITAFSVSGIIQVRVPTQNTFVHVVSYNYFGGSITAHNDCAGICDRAITSYSDYAEITNNLSQGTLNSSRGVVFGVTTQTKSRTVLQYNVANNTVLSCARYYGVDMDGNSATTLDNYYNADKVVATTITITGTSKTDNEIKLRSSYGSWIDFDTNWIIDDKINNGYPFLRCHINYAKVTGFDGSGTQSSPYQIKTTADLQGMQSYYNYYDMIDEYWWKLINDIDISTDANSLTINWTPIAYECGVVSGFNGHFDGNGKTISGLTITEQYENVGLFGKLASNATIINLNVAGSISWDQAKYAGGVAGLMEDGAILTNCSFTGTITGYLNSGNIAVVGGIAGKYSTDAITGSANYDCYVYGTDNYTTFNRYDSTYSVV